MDQLVYRWDTAVDHRAVFARSYRAITVRMERAVAEGAFEDNRWMEVLDVRFAEAYFDALTAHESGEGAVPACWKLAFDLARERRTLVLQDLLLGMNAHILHDLPISLYEVGLAPDERERRRRDHERVNEVLSGMIDEVQRDLSRQYSAALGFLDRAYRLKDELLTDAGIRLARAKAWRLALSLADAPDGSRRAAIVRELDRVTTLASSLIVPPRTRLAGLVPALRRWDRTLAVLLRR